MKSTFRNLTLVSTFLFGSFSFAATDLVGEKTITLNDGKGQALVSMRKVEERLGLPYTIELKVSCAKEAPQWQKLEVVDSEAVCDVKPHSAKLTADGKNISVVVKEADTDAFNEQSQTADAKALGDLRPTCKKAAKKLLIPVASYCQ
ncbi:hypothetical protein QJS83_01790 [Bdellovibrio sp. 22V]|uniref:hypothetical protein n=1 Tax=Bdellovibrio TaxID=958 RepID=UPI0025434A21|nr:hypothetical protein [Bdellovibrio sp. 22V]WII72601.1 hypothetical protein QJS83_01790 [Bdellovibrio sp. 22V]